MIHQCTFNDVIDATLPARRKRFSSQSLASVDRLLEHIGEAADPVSKMFACLSGESEASASCRQDWASMAHAHALDLYDAPSNSLRPLPQVVGEAVHILVRLRSKTASPTWTLQTNDVSLSIHALQKPKGKRPRRGQFAINTMPTLDVSVVERALSARPPLLAFQDAKYLWALLPGTSLPLLTLATGALQALAVAGSLTQLNDMALDDSHAGWAAALHWKARPVQPQVRSPSTPPRGL